MQRHNQPSGRPAESWIDLTAQQTPPPDTASRAPPSEPQPLNSTLRASNQRNSRRRRLTVSAGGPLLLNLPRRPSSIDNSSQDEYDESESESDRVMTSSNEDIYHSTLASQMRRGETLASEDDTEEEEEEDDDDEDDHATALGTGSNLQCFTPQPNAFSHPPSSMNRSSDPVPGSYFPANSRNIQQASSRHSYPSESRRQTHTPYTAVAPSSAADHDALLRDSLSTILSCAAAARGHPKSQRTQPQRLEHIEPNTLRMVPESALLKTDQRPSTNPSATTSSRSSSKGKGKRKAAGSRSRSGSKDRQQGHHTTKKARRASNDSLNNVSPTLLTWCVAGGVVVLVSALSFSAGYVVGKQTGRLESATGLGHGSGSGTGKAALKGGLGLRRSVVGAVSARG